MQGNQRKTFGQLRNDGVKQRCESAGCDAIPAHDRITAAPATLIEAMSSPEKKKAIDSTVAGKVLDDDVAPLSPRRPRPLDTCRRLVDTSDPRSPLTPLSGDGIMRSVRKANHRAHLRTHDAPSSAV